MHAINEKIGKDTSQTMRLKGKYKKRTVNILVDSGSTHNFLDTKVAKDLGLAWLY